MKVRVCPKCEKHKLESVFSCIDCGTTIPINTLLDTDTGLLNVTPIAGLVSFVVFSLSMVCVNPIPLSPPQSCGRIVLMEFGENTI